jgi:hypothetical protein
MTFFTQEKGTLLPEKGHLAKLGGGGPAPPRFLRPAEKLKLTHFFLDCKNIKISGETGKYMIKICAKTRGVKDFISSVGSRLVSGNCHEPEEPIGVSKHENPPCFSGHSFD